MFTIIMVVWFYFGQIWLVLNDLVWRFFDDSLILSYLGNYIATSARQMSVG